MKSSLEMLPPQLRPAGCETLTLPSGRKVGVRKAAPEFQPWKERPPFDTYGGKAVIDLDGEPVFAEVAILRLLERAGWDGVWVDSFAGPKFRKDSRRKNAGVRLPEKQQELFDRIRRTAKSKGGCWDVLCWRDSAILFAESKRKGRDKSCESQLRCLEAALLCGVPKNGFLVVEWALR